MPTSSSVPAPSAAAIAEARDRAIAWSVDHLGTTDPYTVVLLDYVRRRFGLRALDGTAAQLDAQTGIAEGPEARLIDPRRRPTEADLPSDSYSLVAAALACDGIGAPDDFSERLTEAVDLGGYDLTHALVARLVERSLGCREHVSPELTNDLETALRAEIAASHTWDDLAIERIAVLDTVADVDPGDFAIAALLSTQRADGSFGELPADDLGVRTHATALAVWALSAATLPADPQEPLLRAEPPMRS